MSAHLCPFTHAPLRQMLGPSPAETWEHVLLFLIDLACDNDCYFYVHSIGLKQFRCLAWDHLCTAAKAAMVPWGPKTKLANDDDDDHEHKCGDELPVDTSAQRTVT